MTIEIKLVIFGSRGASKQNVFDGIREFFAIYKLPDYRVVEVVCGCAKGADRFGAEYALEAGIPVTHFPADWKKHGNKAGILRNCDMAAYADMGLAIWDGESRGTKHMISEMQRLSKPCYLYIYKPIRVKPTAKRTELMPTYSDK